MKYGPYSPSRLDTARCPYSFYRQYVDPNRPREKKVGSLPQERGGALHEVFEKITQRMCEDKKAVFNSNEIREWTTEAILKHPGAFEETGEILAMAKLYIERPPKVLTSDAQTELRLAIRWDEEAEKFVECDYDSALALARGRADIFMVSDDLRVGYIIDHKTQPNIETADTFQMGFYAWVISKIHPYLQEVRTCLHFARYGCYSDEFVWTKDHLAAIEDDVLTRIAIIENTAGWVSIPNDHCQYCSFQGVCPAMEDFFYRDEEGNLHVRPESLKILGDTQRAVNIAGGIHLLEEVSKAMKSELRDHVKKNGPVAIPGRVYEFRPDEKIDWDKVNKNLREETYEIFKKHGVDPRGFMSFNQTTSQSIWAVDNAALVRELASLFPRKTTTTFAGHKI